MIEPILTSDEHHAVKLAAELWNHLCKTIPKGPTRSADLGELVVHIHAIQQAVMSNAAGRAYPTKYRLLGLSLHTPEDVATRSAGDT